MVAASVTLPTGGLALNQTSFDSHGKSSSGISDSCSKVYVLLMWQHESPMIDPTHGKSVIGSCMSS